MDLNEIKRNLCWYDPRNPDYDSSEYRSERGPAEPGCACDNCFYHRHELALKLLEQFEDLLSAKMILYRFLLRFNDRELTENELDLMVHLSKDEQVQAYLQKQL